MKLSATFKIGDKWRMSAAGYWDKPLLVKSVYDDMVVFENALDEHREVPAVHGFPIQAVIIYLANGSLKKTDTVDPKDFKQKRTSKVLKKKTK